jgi:sulfatase maturation enzyme AslB (radical SAM superfamily)
MNTSENKSYCILPWMNVSVDPDGYVKPCCVSTQRLPYNLGHDTLAEIVNSPEMIQLRQDMIDGKMIPGCNECYQQEKYGGRSLRQVHTDAWQFIPSVKEKFQNPTTEISIGVEYFDLRFGNMCNLQCRSCTPSNSSQLAKEFRQLNIPVHVQDNINDWYQTDTFIENIKSQLDNIKVLYITGGEPTIIEKNFEILEYLINEGKSHDIILQLNTNLTNVKPRFLDLLSKFKYVILFVSIDGIGPVQEYLRYPSKWSQIDKNIRSLLDLKSDNMVIKPTPVIQNVNLSTITDLFEYFERFNRDAGRRLIEIAPIVLNNPKHSDIAYLPLEYKQTQWRAIQEWLDTATYQTPELQTIMNQVKEKCSTIVDYQQELSEFKRQTYIFDNHRGTSLQDVNPELWEILHK